jgi:hypothetical protein
MLDPRWALALLQIMLTCDDSQGLHYPLSTLGTQTQCFRKSTSTLSSCPARGRSGLSIGWSYFLSGLFLLAGLAILRIYCRYALCCKPRDDTFCDFDGAECFYGSRPPPWYAGDEMPSVEYGEREMRNRGNDDISPTPGYVSLQEDGDTRAIAGLRRCRSAFKRRLAMFFNCPLDAQGRCPRCTFVGWSPAVGLLLSWAAVIGSLSSIVLIAQGKIGG